MAQDLTMSDTLFGFLTVLNHTKHGLFGGYLVLNRAGRPLEFHCTAPIKPNRAQEILYGPTLEPFLYGEQIGQTLIERAEHETILVCTDKKPVLAAAEHVSVPVALVTGDSDRTDRKHEAESGASPGKKSLRLDSAHYGGPELLTFQFRHNHLAVSADRPDDQQLVRDGLAPLAESFDLAEPFGRIREAIVEAQRKAG